MPALKSTSVSLSHHREAENKQDLAVLLQCLVAQPFQATERVKLRLFGSGLERSGWQLNGSRSWAASSSDSLEEEPTNDHGWCQTVYST